MAGLVLGRNLARRKAGKHSARQFNGGEDSIQHVRVGIVWHKQIEGKLSPGAFSPLWPEERRTGCAAATAPAPACSDANRSTLPEWTRSANIPPAADSRCPDENVEGW